MANFGLEHGLHQRAEQRMLLQPRMLQAIQVLQLPAAELDPWLERAAEDNPALTVEPRPPSGGGVRGREASERHDQALQAQPDRAPSLAARVEEQLALADLDAELEPWVRFLVGCLDPQGYLSVPDDDLLRLAEEAGLESDLGRLGGAIAALQRLEPRGIGARGAVESLLLQLDPTGPDYAQLCALLEVHLEDLARNRRPGVARALGVDLERLDELLEELRSLELRPAAELVEEAAPPLVPEVLVERGPDGWEVSVENAALPAVAVDRDAERLARDRSQSREVRDYLRGRVEQARWIVDAVEQRRRTLLDVASSVFRRQRAFLEEGPGHRAPLRMQEVADEVGVHVSTVSRAVARKYAQTPWGVLPLRSFFQASAGGPAPGRADGAARDDVREAVGELFAGEDPRAPLSDDDVVGLLAERGLRLARRTVAKYRNELGIPSSYLRRKHR